MTLQDRSPWMSRLGTVGDVPPNALQPPLEDGIHLRWRFDPAKGFPWHGYYRFRRLSQDPRTRRCIVRRRRGHKAGAWPDAFLPVGFGQIPSRVTVQVPAEANVAPPGPYMLFVLERDRVPPEAAFVHVS